MSPLYPSSLGKSIEYEIGIASEGGGFYSLSSIVCPEKLTFAVYLPCTLDIHDLTKSSLQPWKDKYNLHPLLEPRHEAQRG